jgi:hypothetical protein
MICCCVNLLILCVDYKRLYIRWHFSLLSINFNVFPQFIKKGKGKTHFKMTNIQSFRSSLKETNCFLTPLRGFHQILISPYGANNSKRSLSDFYAPSLRTLCFCASLVWISFLRQAPHIEPLKHTKLNSSNLRGLPAEKFLESLCAKTAYCQLLTVA